MNISSTKSPYLLQIERSNKPKATYGNRFRMALKTEKAESQAKDAATDGLEEKDALQANTVPNYTLTEEMADIYREMNGEPYKEDDPFALEEQDDEEKELSIEDAEIASRKNGLFFNESTRNDDIKSDVFDELEISENAAGVDPLQAMEEMTGVSVSTAPANSLSDEDIEYFRNKYGNGFTAENMRLSGYGLKGITYDEYGNTIVIGGTIHYGNEQTKSLFNDLFQRGIISRNDFLYASGGSIACSACSVNVLLRDSELEARMNYVREMLHPDFEEGKNYSWDEYMQMRLNVIDNLRGRDDLDYSAGVLNNWQRSLEKTRAVINQIFGEVAE